MATASTTAVTPQPIGYWVKLLDRLIEDSFEHLLTAERLTRRHWQVLNVVRSGSVGRARLREALTPFLAGTHDDLAQVVEDLRRRDWIIETDGLLSLTGLGEDALATLGEAVRASRSRITEGISELQYTATVDALARMCANLRRSE